MTFEEFIQQANQLGTQQQPFFFVIDFEQEKPIIVPLEQAAQMGLFFQFPQQTNVEKNTSFSSRNLELRVYPISAQAYQQGFSLVQQEIQKGNTYLLNLTYPTEIQTNFSLWDIFQHSQASYKLYYQHQFVCFSPEPFVRIENNQIFTFPMKGTINADLPDAAQQLLASEKESCEHYTIVDLMRNDLATVAKQISVRRFRYVEKIHTEKGAILQTSSEIIGNLEPHWQQQIGSMLAKLLPAGSVSGAPKEKTVEIIQRAERKKRGYYTGIFGIFDGQHLDSAVAIRFIEQLEEQGQQKTYFRSGGGITHQSQWQDEYEELCQKVYIPLKKGNT